MNDFSVYLYRDPKTKILRYVGEGKGKRPFDHLKRSSSDQLFNMLKKRLKEGFTIVPEIISVESKDLAEDLEILLIDEIGRLDLKTGTLFNLTAGGRGGQGRIQTAQERELRSKIMLEYYSIPENLTAKRNALRSENARANNSNAQKKRYQSFAARERTSKANLLRYANGGNTNSANLKKYFLDSGARKKNSDAQKIAQSKPEVLAKKSYPCTIDGITIYPSCKALIRALGQGKSGYKSNQFRFIKNGMLISRGEE